MVCTKIVLAIKLAQWFAYSYTYHGTGNSLQNSGLWSYFFQTRLNRYTVTMH